MDADLDAVDEFRSLIGRFHVLGRELCRAVVRFDATIVGRPIGIRNDAQVFAARKRAQIPLRDVNVGEGIREGIDDRRLFVRNQQVARVQVKALDDAVSRRDYDRFAKAGGRILLGRSGCRELRMGLRDLLSTSPVTNGFVVGPLCRRVRARAGALTRQLRLDEIRVARAGLCETGSRPQIVGAGLVEALPGLISAGREQLRSAERYLAQTRSGFGIAHRRLRGRNLRLALHDRLTIWAWAWTLCAWARATSLATLPLTNSARRSAATRVWATACPCCAASSAASRRRMTDPRRTELPGSTTTAATRPPDWLPTAIDSVCTVPL